jgi:hypothetical protein
MGRPPIGKVAMTDAERHKRYMARLRHRILSNAISASRSAIPQLNWKILVDDDGDGFLSADAEPYELYVSSGDYGIFWYVLKREDDDNDAIEVAEGDASSLVAAMAAAEAAASKQQLILISQ